MQLLDHGNAVPVFILVGVMDIANEFITEKRKFWIFNFLLGFDKFSQHFRISFKVYFGLIWDQIFSFFNFLAFQKWLWFVKLVKWPIFIFWLEEFRLSRIQNDHIEKFSPIFSQRSTHDKIQLLKMVIWAHKQEFSLVFQLF